LNNYDSTSFGGIALGFLAGFFAIVAVVVGFNGITKFKGVDPDKVCVIQEGGLFDGRDVKSVRQPSSGVSFIGFYNSQRCFPATQRHYTLSANADESDSKTVDSFKTPTLDAVEVFIEGQARFALNTDPEVVKAFYKRYGVRTFGGKRPYDGGSGWDNFLAQVFRPVLQNALREAVGDYRCAELNNTCQYVQNADAVTQGKVEEVKTGQNIEKIQKEVVDTLQSRLNSVLGGPYFEDVRFNLVRVSFQDEVEQAVTEAQTKRTEVANARLEAQKKEQEARGRRLAAVEDARAISAKQRAYRNNRVQGEIDKIKALCGESGCTSLQVLGGSASTIIGKP
jgi:regulator of protease activity HflC (stomatin/prohibitin superfamily)